MTAPIDLLPWQSIETAPRDDSEREILLRGEGWISVGWWRDCRYASKPKPYWGSQRERTFGVAWQRANQPTHWIDISDKEPTHD